MPDFSAVNGISSQTHCLKSAAGVGMPALGISGLWALGLGFPRPSCQRISSHSDHRECRTVPSLFSNVTATAYIALCIFHAWWNVANTWQQSYHIPSSTPSEFSLPPSLLSSFDTPLFLPPFPITSSTLLQLCVDELETFFFWGRKRDYAKL